MKYVYACITDKCMRTMEEVQKTRKYKKAQEIAKILHIDNVVIDICSSWNRKKLKLEEILHTQGNIIIITDLTALGKNDEIAAVYENIINKGNDILICYFDGSGKLEADEMSTVDLRFEKKEVACVVSTLSGGTTAALPVDDTMAGFLTPTQYRKTSGKFVDHRIIEAYWEVEKGIRSQRTIVKEIGSSTSTFLRRVNEYVGTDGWIERYYMELETSDIGSRPTRMGEVSEEAKRLYEYFVEHPEDRPDAEERFEIPLEYVVGHLANIYPELEEEVAQDMSVGNKSEEALFRAKKMTVLSWHLFRQVLRYEKYLKRLKYYRK